MNSKKVKDSIGPALVIATFIAVSYFVSSFFGVMSWRDIMTLMVIEFLCFYVIIHCGFSVSRSRVLCTILSLQIVLYSLPYMISAWMFDRFNFNSADAVFDVMYDGYDTVSIVVSILLGCFVQYTALFVLLSEYLSFPPLLFRCLNSS